MKTILLVLLATIPSFLLDPKLTLKQAMEYREDFSKLMHYGLVV